jgi:hypothetical protein
MLVKKESVLVTVYCSILTKKQSVLVDYEKVWNLLPITEDQITSLMNSLRQYFGQFLIEQK